MTMISIHALREEGDPRLYGILVVHIEFLSTPSARRATYFAQETTMGLLISIHALREEGDEEFLAIPSDLYDFYPRPPRGGRRILIHSRQSSTLFLSTPSARRATYWVFESRTGPQFLSTPSARRATRRAATLRPEGANFYPRPPRGGRPWRWSAPSGRRSFLSTPSARRAT